MDPFSGVIKKCTLKPKRKSKNKDTFEVVSASNTSRKNPLLRKYLKGDKKYKHRGEDSVSKTWIFSMLIYKLNKITPIAIFSEI